MPALMPRGHRHDKEKDRCGLKNGKTVDKVVERAGAASGKNVAQVS
jgi:hypothetical protein